MQPTAAQRRTWTGAAAAGRSAAARALHRLAAAAQAQRGQWPLWLPVCFGAGIGVYFSLSAELPLWLLLPAAVIAAAPIVLARRWRGGILFGVFAFAFVAGFAVAQWRALTVAAPVLSQRTGPVVVTGQLIKVERRERDVRLLFDHVDLLGLAAEHTPMRVRVVARAVPTGILPGHWLRVPAVLMPPPRPARPDGFDFARMAWFLQLGGVGYAVGRVERVPAPAGVEVWSPVTRLNALRQRLSERIRAQLPGPTGAVAAALITGDRGAIPKDSVEAMRVSGLAHLLAISGLHIGLVAGTIFFAVRLGLALIEPVALRYPIKKWAGPGGASRRLRLPAAERRHGADTACLPDGGTSARGGAD